MLRHELIKHYAKWEKLDKEGCTAVCFHFAKVADVGWAVRAEKGELQL